MKKENLKSKVILGIVILIAVIGIIGSIIIINYQKKKENRVESQGEDHKNTKVVNGIEILEPEETNPNTTQEKMTE